MHCFQRLWPRSATCSSGDRRHDGQAANEMTYAEARKGIRRAAKYVRSFVGRASASDGGTRTPVAILANAGARSTYTATSVCSQSSQHTDKSAVCLPFVSCAPGAHAASGRCPRAGSRARASSRRARRGARALLWRAVARVQSGGLGELDAIVLERLQSLVRRDGATRAADRERTKRLARALAGTGRRAAEASCLPGTDLPDRSFDSVHSRMAIVHWEDKETIVRRAWEDREGVEHRST